MSVRKSNLRGILTALLGACLLMFRFEYETYPQISAIRQVPYSVNETRPSLANLVGSDGVSLMGEVDFLLDYAIIGHPKTATSFLNRWFQSNLQVLSFKDEVVDLSKGNPAALVKKLYRLPEGNNMIRGYKYPRDIRSMGALSAFSKHWPSTKLIVGVRHPVQWFESFYNFRLRHNASMPDPTLLAGKCTRGSHGVCGDEARFHVHLSFLGKTSSNTDPNEMLLLQSNPSGVTPSFQLPNKVFLYDLNQLYDSNQTRKGLYRSDMSDFLGLYSQLEPLPESHTSQNSKFKLDICDEQFSDLRASLMEIARPASTWIRNYFLKSTDVVVSSPDYFTELLELWMEDPCTASTR